MYGIIWRNMTEEERKEKLYRDVKEACSKLGYELISEKPEVVNNNSRVRYVCPKHGTQEKSAVGLKQGKRCPLCANENKWKKAVLARSNNNFTRREYFARAKEVCDMNNYILLSDESEFTGYKSYIRYSCSIHGEQSMRYGNLVNGRTCPECSRDIKSRKISLAKDDVIKRVQDCGGRIINPDEYRNNSYSNLLIECPRCHKNVMRTSLSHFLQHGGKFCKECYRKESSGERVIREWLEGNNISFVQQKWFQDCRDIKPLPFDFYLPGNNMIIEFDGKQHFEDSHFFNHEDHRFGSVLSYIKYHDEIKNNYCKEKEIALLRISYNELNEIESILRNNIHT